MDEDTSNVHVNKFSWVPHQSLITQKFCQVEITVYELLIKRLLDMYTSLSCYRNS